VRQKPAGRRQKIQAGESRQKRLFRQLKIWQAATAGRYRRYNQRHPGSAKARCSENGRQQERRRGRNRQNAVNARTRRQNQTAGRCCSRRQAPKRWQKTAQEGNRSRGILANGTQRRYNGGKARCAAGSKAPQVPAGNPARYIIQ